MTTPGNGYEIAASGHSSPADALLAWRSSESHHEVILNEGQWNEVQWAAMGAASLDNQSVVWFGKECPE